MKPKPMMAPTVRTSPLSSREKFDNAVKDLEQHIDVVILNLGNCIEEYDDEGYESMSVTPLINTLVSGIIRSFDCGAIDTDEPDGPSEAYAVEYIHGVFREIINEMPSRIVDREELKKTLLNSINHGALVQGLRFGVIDLKTFNDLSEVQE